MNEAQQMEAFFLSNFITCTFNVHNDSSRYTGILTAATSNPRAQRQQTDVVIRYIVNANSKDIHIREAVNSICQDVMVVR